MNSLTDLAGEEFGTHIMLGWVISIVTGAKSPSGCEWADMSAAMLPPAPGLFSTTTDWPQTSCRRLPIRRAVISVEPPGVNGTTMRTGLTGQSAPEAREKTTDGAASA